MNNVDSFDEVFTNLINKDKDDDFMSTMGIFRSIPSRPLPPAIMYSEEPDVEYDLFDGVGKKFGLPDFEVEILIKEIINDDDLISELSDVLVLAKIKHGDKVQKVQNDFNEIRSDMKSTYQRRLKECQVHYMNCPVREELKDLVKTLKSYQDGDKVSDKMFSVVWRFYRKFSLCENPSIENHTDNPALYPIMIQLMDWKKVNDFVEKSDRFEIKTFLQELRVYALDFS